MRYEFRIEIQEKLGEWLEENYPHGGNKKQGSSDATFL